MSKSIRIRTTPNGEDKFLKINLEQDFDFVEILSLKISQKELYTKFCADYGVVVGRVTVNNGFGVPNAKVSVFVPVSEDDKLDPELYGEYPYETISDGDGDGIRYNLLSTNNDTDNECFTPVGSFPNKRDFIDSDGMLDIYCKYYKFTTTTNNAGDYMIFGVPAGAQIMYAEADMSDIGNISQKPYDYIRLGSTEENFDSTTKFKKEENLDAMNHIINRSPMGVDIQPFWGADDVCNVMITRRDVDLKVRITPSAIFIGSIFGDNEGNSVNVSCKPRNSLGVLDLQTAGNGTIEMIRETMSGAIERFDVKGGQLIDKDGTWAYQVPMNLDYRVTDEYGDLVPSDDPTKGLPTKARVRFRIGMNVTGGEGRLRTRGKYLVPHNPDNLADVDYEFGSQTKSTSLSELSWNTIYTVKNHIARFQKCEEPSNPGVRSFIGIKDVDSAKGIYTPFPYDNLFIAKNALFSFLCILVVIITTIIILINLIIIGTINGFLHNIVNPFLTFFSRPTADYFKCIKLLCSAGAEERWFAPGCDADDPPGMYGCEAAGGPPAGNVWCVDAHPTINCWGCTDWWGDAGFTQCIASGLAENLNLLKFDFYNDWVNGTLYSPLFKYKKNKDTKGREKFCEWACGGYNGIGVYNGDPLNTQHYDNDCYEDTWYIDSCVAADVCSTDIPGVDPTAEGVIHKLDDTLYYAPYSRHVGRKLYATDIVSLGSSVKCHYDATPMVQSLFIDTTYQMPPLLAEDSLIDGDLVVMTSGIDSAHKDIIHSLFVDINCLKSEALSQQCGNIRRQCELGVGLDDATHEPDGTYTEPGVPVELLNPDIDVKFARNVFAWLNNEELRILHPNAPEDVDCQWVGHPNCGDIVGTDDYNIFRYHDVDYYYGKWTTQKTEASFYFYFGLNAASTALSKLRERYFAPCPVIADSNFVVIGTVTPDSGVGDGAIDVTVIGGTAPYTYIWTGPNGYSETITPSLLIPDGDIDNLEGGSYTVTVVDAAGNSTSTTFIVDAPLPLTCSATQIAGITVSDGTPNSDGIMVVTSNGGAEPYDITITNIDTTYTDSINDTYNSTNMFYDLPAGEYTIVVVDDTGVSCSSNNVSIGTPPALGFVVNSTLIIPLPPLPPLDPELASSYEHEPGAGDPNCHGANNGYINIHAFGGTPPYAFSVADGTGNVISTNSFTNGLPAGEYNISVMDADNNTAPNPNPPPYLITLFEPAQYDPTFVSLTPATEGNSDGSIEVNSNGGVAPYQCIINGEATLNQILPFEFTGLAGDEDYEIKLIDDVNCHSTILVYYLPES